MSSEYLLKVIIVGEPLDLIAQMVYLQEDPKIPPPSLEVDINSFKIKLGQSSINLMLHRETRPHVISKELIDKYYNSFDEFIKDYREYYGREYGGKVGSWGLALGGAWYRGASSCIITYDKGNRDSFNAIKKWYQVVCTHVSSQDIPIALVGFNTNSKEVTSEEGQELADELGMDYFETKTTDKERVIKIYKNLAKKFLSI
ncbi:MAG: hypothetical protein ACFFAJ_12875 [Candidatus Hodarchaeota archaeon]